MRAPSRRALAFASAAGAAAVVLGWFVYHRFGRHRPRYPYFATPLAADDYRAMASRPGWEASTTIVEPDVSLRGLIRRPTAASAPWVLFYSGNTQTQLATAQQFLDRLRGDRDWGLAAYAYRGYDSSDGVPSRDPMVADAFKVFEGLCQREHVDPARVHLVAFSLGGYFALHVASDAAKANKRAASLSVMGSVEDIDMVTASWPVWAIRIAPGEVYDTKPFLDAVPAPVAVIHESADDTVAVTQGRTLAAELGNRARYLELPGVGHVPILQTEAALAAVRAMIEAKSPADPHGP